MDQSQVNKEMTDLGKSRYWNRINKAREVGLESTTDAGQRLLSESISKLQDAIDRWIRESERKPGRRHRAHQYITLLPSKVVAAITAQAVLDCISQNRKIVSTATQVARLLQDEVQFRHLRENEPALWEATHRNMNKNLSSAKKAKFISKSAMIASVSLPAWEKKDLVQVGIVCIELMREATGIIDIVTRSNVLGKSVTLVRPTDELMSWLKLAHKSGELLRPVYLPMVETPVDWVRPVHGGYGIVFARNRPLIKSRSKSYLGVVEASGMPEVYSAVNTLQRTAFRINEDVLRVFETCWENGRDISGIPSSDAQIPTKPVDIDTNEEARRQWRKEAARVHFENERNESKKLQISKILYLANKFSGRPIWYPRQLDFRGREYPIPYYLQPQGPDVAKGLLLFNEGKPIDESNLGWMAIHIANCFGNDKMSFQERINWVNYNDDWIKAIGENPLDIPDWSSADKPLQFLAGCIEWAKFRRFGLGYVSHLPISIDATTQGLQLYSLLLKDEVGAMATNCLPRDRPNDIYGQVADVVKQKLREDTNKYAKTWLEFGINRSTTKRQTMTLPYGSTFYSCKTYTTEWFYETLKSKRKVNPFGDETYRPCTYLAEIIWKSISEVVGSAQVCMSWLQSVSSVCCENGVTPMWWTPNNFFIDMRYEQTNAVNIKTSIGRVIRQHQMRQSNGKIDNRKTKNAIAPNFIHGLDGIGGLLGKTVNQLSSAYGVTSIRSTHDEIAVLAADAGPLSTTVRQMTVEMFQEDILGNFSDQISALLPSHVCLPPVPPKGTLDISKVMESDYYFS